MDPTEALKDIRSLSKRAAEEDPTPVVSMLIDTVDGLDGWISAGGFLPDQWRNKRGGRPRRDGDGDEVRTDVRHGTRNGYNKGCHCVKCTAANREHAAAFRARQKQSKEN